MVESRQYLIVWELGDNEQSIEMTPVTAKVSKQNTEDANFENIMRALCNKVGENYDDNNIQIISMSVII